LLCLSKYNELKQRFYVNYVENKVRKDMKGNRKRTKKLMKSKKIPKIQSKKDVSSVTVSNIVDFYDESNS